MKRLTRSSLLAIVVILAITLPVLAATYYANIQVQETNSNSYAELPLIYSIDNDYLADSGYIEADGLDTRVITGAGTALPHLVVDDSLLFVSDIGADSTTNLKYTFGNSDLASMPVVVGYGGLVTTSDAAVLELSNSFEIEQKGYIDTSASNGYNLLYKQAAFRTFATTDAVVSSILPEIITFPTGWSDPDGRWLLEPQAYNNNTADGAGASNAPATSWSSYVIFTHAGIECYATRFYAEYDATEFTQIDIDVYYDAAWHDVYQGIYTDLTWTTKYMDGLHTVTQARVRFYNTNAGVITESDLLREFTFYGGTVDVGATGVTTGVHIVKTTADGTNLKLYIDDVLKDTEALGASSVPPNANNYLIMNDNVMPYMEFFKLTAPLAQGKGWYSIDSGVNWADAGEVFDFMFEEYAGTTLHEYHNTGDNGYWECDNQFWQSQTFVPTTTHNISSVKLKIYRSGAGSPHDFTVYVKAVDAAHKPTGAALATGVIDADLIELTPTWEEITFAAPTTLTAETEYALVWEASGAGADGVVKVRDEGPGTYEADPKLWYQPIDIISGTTLPDRLGLAQNGAITWGANPAGISITMGSLISEEQPVPSGVVDEPVQDIVGETSQPGWTSATETLTDHPFYPMVLAVTENTDFSTEQVWLGGATFIVLAAMLAMFRFVPHQLITVIVGGALTGFFISMGIYPFWVIFVFILAGVAVVLWERTPAV